MRLHALANAIREDLLMAEGVRKLILSRRAAAIFSVGTPANHVYFLDSGLVKIEKTTDSDKEILLGVVAAGELFGEQGLLGESVFTASAKVLESGVAYSIPTDVFQRFCERRPDVWRLLLQHFLGRKDELERKIEHLCHSDVKQRLVYYLEDLARLNPTHDPGGTVIHISQNELASLVGATRETTSTTLNALARQGLIALGHRLVMIPSLEQLARRCQSEQNARQRARHKCEAQSQRRPTFLVQFKQLTVGHGIAPHQGAMKWPILFLVLLSGVLAAREDTTSRPRRMSTRATRSKAFNSRVRHSSASAGRSEPRSILSSVRSSIPRLWLSWPARSAAQIHKRVTHKIERGDSPEHVRVVYLTSDRPVDDEPEVTKIRYHHKQGWTGGLEAGHTIRPHTRRSRRAERCR